MARPIGCRDVAIGGVLTDHLEGVAWPASREGEGAGLLEGGARGGPDRRAEEEGGDLGRHCERPVVEFRERGVVYHGSSNGQRDEEAVGALGSSNCR